jgi:hypothetical protein
MVVRSFVLAAGTCFTLVAAAWPQAAPAPVDFRPFADGRNWIVRQPLIYRIGQSQDSVIVPAGFVTDLASIPPALQSFIQQNGPYLLPAVVHDYLYWKQSCTRFESDRVLLLGMIENGVESFPRNAIYDAVRAAGFFAWNGNTKERQDRRLRILPADRRNIQARTLWPDYQKQLMEEGVEDGPDLPISPAFCARADLPVSEALGTP